MWRFVGVAVGLVVLLVALLGGLSGTAAPRGVSTLGRMALWLPLVQTETQRYGVPPALELGLIAYESGGNYLATTQVPNGTTDAGLAQINSGPAPADPNWVAFGLQADPFDPAANVAASVRTLAGDLEHSDGNVPAALSAYQAGSASGDRAEYVSAVLAASAEIEAGPILAAWPVGGKPLPLGAWRVPAMAGSEGVYVVITAMGPAEPPASGPQPRWLALLAPTSITATADGRTRAVALSSTAPRGLRALMPPATAYWWLVVPVPTAGDTVVSLTATWPAPPQQPATGSGATPTPGSAPQASATLTLERS